MSSTASAPHATASTQLILADDEVLAQERHVDGGANLLQMFEAAVEERRLGEDGNRRRPGLRVRGRVRRRVVVLCAGCLSTANAACTRR